MAIDVNDPASGGWIAKPEDRQGFTPREGSEAYDEAVPIEHEHGLNWSETRAEYAEPRKHGIVRIEGVWRVTAGKKLRSGLPADVVLSIEEAYDSHSCEISEPLASLLAQLLPHVRMAASGEELFLDPAYLRDLLEGRA